MSTQQADLLLEWNYKGKNPFQTFFFLYKGDWHFLALAAVSFIIKHSGVWAMPLLMANMIDFAAKPEEHDLSDFWGYVFILVIIFLQNIPTHYIFSYAISTASRNMENRLRVALARRFQQLSMNYYAQNSVGILQSKILRDVEILQTMTMQIFQTVPAALVTLIFALVVTAVRVPEFLFIYLLIIPASVGLVHSLRQPMQRRNRDFREEVQDLSARLIEMLRLIPLTRAHGIEDEELERVVRKLDTVRNTGHRLDMINALFGASSWVTFNLFEVFCLAVAVYGVYTQVIPITVGEVVMLTGFFRNLTASVLQFATIFPEIAKGVESIHSVAEVLENPDVEQNEGKKKISNVQGNFCFESVFFSYPDTDDSAIHNFSLEVSAGEVIAFVGPSGAGKSTLLNLIIGFIRPTSGRILLDGQPMNDLDLRSYRRYLSVVPQDNVLFEGTIRDNILYGRPNIDEKHLTEAVQAANAAEFIAELPQGLDTLVGENGTKLSGGQRQRIAIARALIRNPRVLILDEATSALDSQSEQLIQQALDRLLSGRTAFIVAHRLSTIYRADRIIVLDKGHIIEMGKHETLLAQNGLYAALHRTQHPQENY